LVFGNLLDAQVGEVRGPAAELLGFGLGFGSGCFEVAVKLPLPRLVCRPCEYIAGIFLPVFAGWRVVDKNRMPPDGDFFERLVFRFLLVVDRVFFTPNLSGKVKPAHKPAPAKDRATYSNPVSRTTPKTASIPL
jgi:hypothetical protein